MDTGAHPRRPWRAGVAQLRLRTLAVTWRSPTDEAYLNGANDVDTPLRGPPRFRAAAWRRGGGRRRRDLRRTGDRHRPASGQGTLRTARIGQGSCCTAWSRTGSRCGRSRRNRDGTTMSQSNRGADAFDGVVAAESRWASGCPVWRSSPGPPAMGSAPLTKTVRRDGRPGTLSCHPRSPSCCSRAPPRSRNRGPYRT